MPIRTIKSPGVEIVESDRSMVSPATVGTTFLVMGYADKGVELRPLEITSLSDFETNFGIPTNEAERYFYYASREVLRTGSNLVAAKLPYANTIASNYKCVGLSFEPMGSITGDPVLSGMIDMQGISGYFPNICRVDETSVSTLPTSAYDVIKTGDGFHSADTPSLSACDFIIVNELKSRYGGAKSNEGVFVVVVDPVDALRVQRVLPTMSDSDVFSIFQGIDSPSGIVYTDFAEPLIGLYGGGSVSEGLAALYPSIPFKYIDGSLEMDTTYGQKIGIVVCETVSQHTNEGKLKVSYLESFVGSVHPAARDKATGQTAYIADIVNSRSGYIRMYRNLSTPFPLSIDDRTVSLWNPDGYRGLMGFSDDDCIKWIDGRQVGIDMGKVFEKLSNVDETRVDVVVDAGLSTIAMFCDVVNRNIRMVVHHGDQVQYKGLDVYHNINQTDLWRVIHVFGSLYDPDSVILGTIDNEVEVEMWRSVCEGVRSFCQEVRGDCIGIIDTPRNLVLEGGLKYIRPTSPEGNFTNTIGGRLKYVSGFDSAYLASYCNWVRIVDTFTKKPFWLPPTCKVCGVYGVTDKVANIWEAPAGLNRGILDGVSDISFNPKQNESDQIYSKGINYAKWSKSDGYWIEGQKTTMIGESVFSRVGARRMVFRLERFVRNTARYFVMENNTPATRRDFVDAISVAFESVVKAGGLKSYKIICDSTNNTDDVVDRNELRCSITFQATGAIEYILFDFIATRTGETNFTELVAISASV